ncbi:MAG: PAS domain-containing protein [Alphaproteobacteria bacterium]
MLHATLTGLGETQAANAPPASCHPKIRDVYAYWLKIHPSHGLPGRQHFEPTDVPGLLRHLRLLEVEGDPPRFKVRVIGTQYSERLGGDATGRYLDELFEGFSGSRFHRALMEIVEIKRPVWRRGPLQWFCREQFTHVERIHLPLARDGSTVDMVLTVCVYQN